MRSCDQVSEGAAPINVNAMSKERDQRECTYQLATC
jgi:hypothetical protein